MKKIPKGSAVFVDEIYKATINKDIFEGVIIQEEDFTPEIPNGTKLDLFECYYKGKLIYRHPNFIKP